MAARAGEPCHGVGNHALEQASHIIVAARSGNAMKELGNVARVIIGVAPLRARCTIVKI
jgi:hypothetical protein